MTDFRQIPFVDAHIHLWDLEHLRYPWLMPPFSDEGPNGSVEAIAQNYLLDDYLADAKNWNVVGAVHIDAGAHPGDALRETAWLQGMADRRGLPNGIVAFAALDDPNVEPLLEAHAAHRNVRSIRHIVNWHPNPRRTYTPRDVTGDPAWQRGFGLLAKYGLSFDLQAYANQFAGLAELIGRHPDTQVVINHAGMPVDTDSDGRAHWSKGMRRLAELPNVAVKISGLGFVHRPPTLDLIRPYVREVVDTFGPARCMVASDFPTDKLFGSFDDTLGAVAASISDLSDDEQGDLWSRNADRIYRLGLPNLTV
ncbi:amidohydrolase family protein [Sphingomonas tabacisoli]|uniref:Amidohydrolase family protein n=1 Tax=Sphingomonas tabacisoli TaxID=2249466 RepID=A0ABW4I7B8_9SPHN